jgi:hypothetical protein
MRPSTRRQTRPGDWGAWGGGAERDARGETRRGEISPAPLGWHVASTWPAARHPHRRDHLSKALPHEPRRRCAEEPQRHDREGGAVAAGVVCDAGPFVKEPRADAAKRRRPGVPARVAGRRRGGLCWDGCRRGRGEIGGRRRRRRRPRRRPHRLVHLGKAEVAGGGRGGGGGGSGLCGFKCRESCGRRCAGGALAWSSRVIANR